MGQDQADIQICFENFQKKIGSSKHGLLLVFYCAMVKQNVELREVRKQKLPTATTFSPRDSLSKLSSPLGLPKEFAEMEQKLQERYPKEEDSIFSKSPVPFA